MGVRTRAWFKFAATRFGGLAVDLLFLAAVYAAAILLRFDLRMPRWGWTATALSFVSVGVVGVLSMVATGCYSIAWRRTGLRSLPRYVLAVLLACAVLTVLRFLLPIESYAHIRPPYSVTLITSALSLIALFGWRALWTWSWRLGVKETDLLEREERTADSEVARRYFSGRTVMVTGAGGSIGSEIVRQLLMLGVGRVLMVERSENALYEIDREVSGGAGGGVRDFAVPLMKDVNDVAAMRRIFEEHRPTVVLHAAAYKHVPMVEANPEEGWRNNTEATKQLAELSREYGVERFVMISTDKAVNPVSVMGKTKLAAEKAILALNTSAPDSASTSFAAVRFGNVLGSSGSVVPLFREQIAKKRPITVTHPEMKRYFMTISEAVSLVLQAATRSEKAIYTLDMGKPVRIVDLAEEMIRQAGYKPYIDIPIVFTGIRPGEKLFEELDVSEKSCYRTDMAKIYITRGS